MKTLHTPGPWGYTHHAQESSGRTGGYYSIYKGLGQICELSPIAGTEANARLIAAAPELLAMVELLLLPHMGDGRLHDMRAAHSLITRVKG